MLSVRACACVLCVRACLYKIIWPNTNVASEIKYIITHIAKWSRQTDEKRSKPGGRLNKKDGLTRYGDSHVKDKTFL